jgi:hypothetical protein
MDGILYFKIRSRGSLDSDSKTSNHTSGNVLPADGGYIFDSLPVKKILVGPTVSKKNALFAYEDRCKTHL